MINLRLLLYRPSFITSGIMQPFLITFLIISTTFGQDLPYQASIIGPQMPSSFFGYTSRYRSPLIGDLDVLNFLNKGMIPTNPGLDLLAHGLGFGVAALRGLGIVLQDNEANRKMTHQ
ncbi:Uncharacterized protein BM_BM8819 [Brugia malayi]|uniref:Bm8819 n=1 Tax=Brugia malayi TaxID=6279 RepID=A0A0J9XND3_BRUMA|nr:Uncharacterized protein BM_BM8819 [Brugia malayi]CDP92072.1 Bm8819 [Brugia malayi]VIO92319.1 Uncharacterized protein BM_BM8819 [Brugia malayi]